MQITLRRLNKAVHFECTNAEGKVALTDGSPQIGGESKGVRPMEMLLMSLASCSSIDVVTILEKMRQPLDDIRVEVNGERDPGETPAVFRKIHLHFHLYGQLKEDKVAQALELSIGKYCSVAKMLESTAAITWAHSIHPIGEDFRNL